MFERSKQLFRGRNDIEEQRADGGSRVDWRWRATLMGGLLIPVFLETLDYTIVATAQPHIASQFGRLDLQSWIGTIYLLTSTVFLPLFASIADIYGRHFGLQLSLLFFLIGSALSTGAPNMPSLLAGRGIAGVGAAGMTAVVRVILADSNSLNDNNWQTSMLSLLYTVGYVVGPVLGGALTSVSFRWVFAINLPCTVLGMALSFFLLRKHLKKRTDEPPRGPFANETMLDNLLRLDWIGVAFFVTAGVLVLLALSWGSTGDWSDVKVIVSFVLGGVLFAGCILWEWVLEREQTFPMPSGYRVLWAEPILPLDIFRSYDICAVQAGSFVSGMVMLVMFYFVSIFMTIVSGRSATDAGAQLLYLAPGLGGGTYTAIYIVKYLRQPKYAIMLGGVIMAASLGLISMALDQNNQDQVNGFMAMSGIGIGMSIGPLSTQARLSQPANRVSAVISLTLFFLSLGGTVGLAQCGAVLNAKVSSYVTSLVRSGAISADQAASLAFSASNSDLSSVNSIAALSPQLQEFVKNAFRSGVRWSFISLVPWAVIAAIVTFFLSDIPDTDAAPPAEAVELGAVEAKVSRPGYGQASDERAPSVPVGVDPPTE